MNTLTAIGWIGSFRVYLNLTEEEARRRYKEETGDDPANVKTVEFDDVFYAYEVGEAFESIVAAPSDEKAPVTIVDPWNRREGT